MKLKEWFSLVRKKISEMNPKTKMIILISLCVVLVAAMVTTTVILLNNNKDNGNKGNNPGGTIIGGDANGNTEYTVKVQTVGGMPLEGVMVYIHNGDGYSVCTAPQETNKDGIAKFTLKTSNAYTVQVDGVPKGYNVRGGETKDDRYPLNAPDTVISLSSAPVKEGGFASSYDLGDVMYDFTLTDINGDDYKLSELLKTKDMVMLNFWYVGCSNCAMEFPYVNDVYDAYKDDIEILAINDYPDDTLEDVKKYSEYLNTYWGVFNEGEELKMPLFKVGNNEDDLTLSKFDSNGYPTTIIIDRYGVVVMVEVGAVLGESKWKNVFDRFVGDNYKQELITDPSILNPMIEPTIKWTDESADQIANAFNSGDITVTYHPETNEKDAKYAWPFIVDTYNGETVVRPSNNGVDNSFSILYAEVSLKPGQAIMFDYFCSTQRNEYGTDVLYVLVDGKDIYSMAGINENGYEVCCTYVDPRPVVPGVNDNDVATYSVAFAYYKDTVDYSGDDTVYLKNLRVVPATEIPVKTYIFRYAATDLNAAKDGYNTYVEVFYNEADGYYHVGSKNGPLLLANHLSYTNFDSQKTLSERVHANYELIVDGKNMFNNWLIYGNAASNSVIPYYTPVTQELKDMLVAYCNTYKGVVGKADNANLWLQLCAYYDAYGTVDDVPTPHLEDPIIGLTSFSAYVMSIKDGTYTKNEIVASAEVEYTKVIMPRGYLYKFVPKVSGVYRVTSKSTKEVNGWIFVDGDKWADEGDRIMLTSDEVAERYNPDLIVEVDGKLVHDNVNTSLVAYMEAGKEYYIDIAYYDTAETGKFSFDVKWIGETFGYFVQASPGPVTYIESISGGMGQLLAAGIDVVFVEENGVEYAYHLLGKDENGNNILGSKIYADFHYPTTLFQTQSIKALIEANAFNFTITAEDRQALIFLDTIRVYGKTALINKWIADGTVADKAAGEEKWTNDGLDAVIKDYYDSDFDGSYTLTQQADAIYVWTEGTYGLMKDWAISGIKSMSTAKWESLDMDAALRAVSEDGLNSQQKDVLREVNDIYNQNWTQYKVDEVRNGNFHNTDNRTAKDIKALEYLDILDTKGKNELKAIWDDVFSSITPAEGSDVTDISEWRYNYLWNYYQMDDVKAGRYHGTNEDYTAIVKGYLAKVDSDNPMIPSEVDPTVLVPTYPERQGCVAVTRELANILDTLIAREVFEDVQNGWLKFCFYYDYLGA